MEWERQRWEKKKKSGGAGNNKKSLNRRKCLEMASDGNIRRKKRKGEEKVLAGRLVEVKGKRKRNEGRRAESCKPERRGEPPCERRCENVTRKEM